MQSALDVHIENRIYNNAIENLQLVFPSEFLFALFVALPHLTSDYLINDDLIFIKLSWR